MGLVSDIKRRHRVRISKRLLLVSCLAFFLSGCKIAVDTEPFDYGNVAVKGQPSVHEFVIENKGGSSLTISVEIVGDPSFNVQSPVAGSEVKINAHSTLGVKVAYDPVEIGSKQAQLKITHNDSSADNPIMIDLSGVGTGSLMSISTSEVDFGKIELGSEPSTFDVMIENSGNADLRINASLIEHLGFSVVSPPNRENVYVKPGTGLPLTVRYAPQSVGVHERSIRIDHNALNMGSPVKLRLLGEGIQGKIWVDTKPFDFGGIPLGNSPSVHGFLIRNDGSGVLTISANIYGSDCFSFPGSDVYEDIDLMPGDEQVIYVQFDAREQGTERAGLRIYHNDPTVQNPRYVHLRGAGTRGAIAVNSGDIDFGHVMLAGSMTHTFTIQNTGNGSLYVDLGLSGDQAFKLSNTTNHLEIGAYKKASVNVQFDPSELGAYSSQLIINHSDSEVAPYVINLAGIGVDPLCVDGSATGENSGADWPNAFKDLQAALSVAQPGDQIWVAGGVYLPSLMVPLGNDEAGLMDVTFNIPDGVKLYGGFSGAETGLIQRDYQQNKSILSGDMLQNDDGVGSYQSSSDPVVFVGEDSLVDGAQGSQSGLFYNSFYYYHGEYKKDDNIWYDENGNGTFESEIDTIITLGTDNKRYVREGDQGRFSESLFYYDADGSGGYSHGEGVWQDGDLLENVRRVVHLKGVSEQTLIDGFTIMSSGSHGGIYFDAREIATNVQMENCIIEKNGGVGIWLRVEHGVSSFELNNCVVRNNSGAIKFRVKSSGQLNAELKNCNIVNNDYGGGVSAWGSYRNRAVVNMYNCKIDGNRGGGLEVHDSDVALFNCSISGNTSGQALQFSDSCDFVESKHLIVNSVIANNHSATNGTVVNYDTNPIFINSTFYGNSLSSGTLLNQNIDGSSKFKNCIIMGAGEMFGGHSEDGESHRSAFVNCNIQGSGGSGAWDKSIGIDGGGNIDVDPSFISESRSDFRLRSDSPCIDTGDTSLLPADIWDLDKDGDVEEPLPLDFNGNSRVVGAVDMGAYEYQQ